MNAKEKAKAIRERADRIAGLNGGRLTPDAMVEDAINPDSPLHDQFEWDNEKAGHQYRLGQARELIRTIKCEENILETLILAPHYVRDPTAAPEEQGYIAITRARSDRELAHGVMRDEIGRVIAAIERARAVSEILGLTHEIEELLARAVGVRARIVGMTGEVGRANPGDGNVGIHVEG